jgi:hypothetical protein
MSDQALQSIRMTRLLLITLLLLSSGPAYAEWVAVVSGSDEEGSTVYMDPDTFRRNGDLVKRWHLYDYKTAQTTTLGTFFSFKVLNQYHCTEERARRLTSTFFSGNMGTGKVLFTNADEGKWEPVAPESVGQVLRKVACNKQ